MKPVEDLLIVSHSMGGLVARSALHQAAAAGQTWPQRLRKLVFLGTPHHGAPLERAGSVGSMAGDGLVMIDSALGKHKRSALDLGLDKSHTWVRHGIHRLDLLSDPAVYRRLLGWLQL